MVGDVISVSVFAVEDAFLHSSVSGQDAIDMAPSEAIRGLAKGMAEEASYTAILGLHLG